MNTTLVEQFLSEVGGQKDIAPAWERNKRFLALRFLSFVDADHEQCTTEDLLHAFKVIRRKSKFKQNYRRQLVNTGKQFSLWLAEKKNTKINAKKIEGVELPKSQWKTKKPEDMLSMEEIEKVIQAGRNARDKCLLAMLYDGSNRPIELLRLIWQDIVFDEYGAYFITDAKTKKERRIRLTTISLPYLDVWRMQHPDPRPEQPVFCTVNKSRRDSVPSVRPLTIDNVQRTMKDIKKRTGIKKLKASLFRPSRITADVKAGVALPYVMKKNWGSMKTKMIDLYTNLDDAYMDETALGAAGMDRKEKGKETKAYKIELPVCPSCGKVNVLDARYCLGCLSPLTPEVQATQKNLYTVIETDPELAPILEQLKALAAKRGKK